MADYDIGDKPTITATFTNEAGTLTDPSTVAFMVRTPAGVETSAAFTTHPSTGVYTYQLPTFDLAGTWIVRSKATGATLTGAKEDRFEVRRSGFTAP
jgi:hypothetical protein